MPLFISLVYVFFFAIVKSAKIDDFGFKWLIVYK